MTAEMVIMNRSAVALAADSAVTITTTDGSGQPGVRKIYANANKLFELIRGRPVGMLIYDSADLAQVPWETLVKRYRRDHQGASFPTLTEYAESFCQYLNKEIHRLIPEPIRTSYLHYCVHKISRDFLGFAESRISSKANETEPVSRINNQLRKDALDGLMDELEGEISNDEVADWAAGLDEELLLKKFGTDSLNFIPDTLQRLRLTQTQKKRLCKLAYAYILRRATTPSTTGIAIAGFGEDDAFPSIAHFLVGGIIDDRLVVFNHETAHISASKPSHLIPLAQVAEASTFLFGIDPAVKDRITAFWELWLGKLDDAASKLIEKELSDIPKSKLQAISSRISEYGDASWNVFADYMNKLHIEMRYGPIESSAAFLSKGELAGLAENLVDLASLRNRVSINRAETVGGAIDVAVVSPGDGFVWIKRKHYFDLEFNPNWPGSRQSNALQSDHATGEGN